MRISLILLYILYFGEASIVMNNGVYPNEHLGLVKVANLTNWYYFSKSKATFFEASNFCLMYGMDLAKFETRFESDTIFAHIRTLIPNHFFISANKLGSSDQWRWIDGTPVSFTSWAPGEPGQTSTNFCMIISKNAGWNDATCIGQWGTYNFICKTREET